MFAGQPVALVIAKTEATAEDGAELLVVDYEPSRLSSTSRRRWRSAPRSPAPSRSRTTRAATSSRSRPVDKGQEDDAGEQLSGNVLDRVTREHGDVAAAFAASDAWSKDVPDAVGLPGVHRAAGVHRLARAVRDAGRLDEHAGIVRHAAGARRAFDLPLERVA